MLGPVPSGGSKYYYSCLVFCSYIYIYFYRLVLYVLMRFYSDMGVLSVRSDGAFRWRMRAACILTQTYSFRTVDNIVTNKGNDTQACERHTRAAICSKLLDSSTLNRCNYNTKAHIFAVVLVPEVKILPVLVIADMLNTDYYRCQAHH